MYKFFTPILFVCSFPVFATSQVKSLNVAGEIVTFETTLNKTSNPACVTDENQDLWSFSLDNKSGRALYALLVAAFSNNNEITVVGADDCSTTQGVERASGASLAYTSTGGASKNSVHWMGYTDYTQGNFGENSSAVNSGSELCAAKFPGSRLMLWDDYVKVIADYPNTNAIWFPDAVQSISYGLGKTNANYMHHQVVLLKNGQSIISSEKNQNEYPSGTNSSGGVKFEQNFNCYNWTIKSSYRGIIMQGTGNKGRFTQTACSMNNVKLACVK